MLIENEHIHASDFIKIEYRVEYEHIPKEQMEGYVHSRNFPYLKKHGWVFLLVDGKTGEKIHMNVDKSRFEDKFAKPTREDDFKEYDGSIYHINK